MAEHLLWQVNEENGFYTAFRRTNIWRGFPVDLPLYGSLLGKPTERKCKQD